jgi:hypothetical protein
MFQNENKSKQKLEKETFYWNNNLIKDKLSILRFNFDDYMSNDAVLKESLTSLIDYGFIIVNNVRFFFKKRLI